MTGPAFHDAASTSWDSNRAHWQDLLNAHEIPPRGVQRDMPAVRVRARLVWADDGEETIEAHSDAYAGRLVLVHTRDLRLAVRSVWLDADDVQRI